MSEVFSTSVTAFGQQQGVTEHPTTDVLCEEPRHWTSDILKRCQRLPTIHHPFPLQRLSFLSNCNKSGLLLKRIQASVVCETYGRPLGKHVVLLHTLGSLHLTQLKKLNQGWSTWNVLQWWRDMKILYNNLIKKLITEFTPDIWLFGGQRESYSRILKLQGRKGDGLNCTFFFIRRQNDLHCIP